MINSLIVSFSVCLTACVVEVGEETSVLTYTDASSFRHQVLNSIPHLNPFTLQLSVMCFRFVLGFFAPHWMRCEFSHHPPDTWRSYRSPGLTDGYIMAKLGGRVEKQCELYFRRKFSVSTWECEVSCICAIFESCKKASTCFAVL